ncbi:MAG TPA: hypothetical protein VIT22_02475 [Pseudoxanthomonas sp.]
MILLLLLFVILFLLVIPAQAGIAPRSFLEAKRFALTRESLFFGGKEK